MGTLRWGSVMSVLLFLCTISIANARTVLRNANDALILDELFGDSPFPENDDFRWSYQEHGIPEEDVEQRNILMKVLRSKTQTRRKRPLGFENIDLVASHFDKSRGKNPLSISGMSWDDLRNMMKDAGKKR